MALHNVIIILQNIYLLKFVTTRIWRDVVGVRTTVNTSSQYLSDHAEIWAVVHNSVDGTVHLFDFLIDASILYSSPLHPP